MEDNKFFCKTCGAELIPHVRFCNKCGAMCEQKTAKEEPSNIAPSYIVAPVKKAPSDNQEELKAILECNNKMLKRMEHIDKDLHFLITVVKVYLIIFLIILGLGILGALFSGIMHL